MSSRIVALLGLGIFAACGGSTVASSNDASDGGVPPSGDAGSTPSQEAGASVVDAGRAADAGRVAVVDAGACASDCIAAHHQGESAALLGLYDCMTKTSCQAKCQPALQQRDWTADCIHCVDMELEAGACESHCTSEGSPDCLVFQQCVAACP